jgi:hypothetical protein
VTNRLEIMRGTTSWKLWQAGLSALLILALVPRVYGTDLAKIDRTIKKEPAYRTKPRYCLLVFGPKGETRAWLVLDGDTLYIDRNGNGDLTEDGERMKEALVDKEPNPVVAETHQFVDLRDPAKSNLSDEDRDVPVLKGTSRYRRFSLSYGVLNKPPKTKSPKEEAKWRDLEERFDGVVNVYVWVGRVLQCGTARFSARASDAPILHFDGPMVFELGDTEMKLPPDGGGSELSVRLTTPGLGRGAVTRLINFTGVPTDVHPIAQIEFPSKHPGAPIRRTTVLDHRC